MNNLTKSLENEFNETVKNIDNHTKELSMYCECIECQNNRRKLNDLSNKMNTISYTRKAMF